jgi:hypothetical protein
MAQHDVNIPAGFTILDDSPGETQIAYRSAGMGRQLWFLGIGVVGLAGGLAFFAITQPAALRHVILGDWWAPFAFLAGISAIVYFAWFVIFHAFGETVFSVTSDRVAVSRRLFGLALTNSISRSDVSHLEQIKDGGDGEDSFPSWGLRLMGRRKCWLISRQPIEKSDWLGNRLAEMLSVEFRASKQRPERST